MTNPTYRRIEPTDEGILLVLYTRPQGLRRLPLTDEEATELMNDLHDHYNPGLSEPPEPGWDPRRDAP